MDAADPEFVEVWYGDTSGWSAEIGLFHETESGFEDLAWFSATDSTAMHIPLDKAYRNATLVVAYLWSGMAGPSSEPDYFGAVDFDATAPSHNISWWMNYGALADGVVHYAASRETAIDLKTVPSIELDFGQRPYYLLTSEEELDFQIVVDAGSVRAFAGPDLRNIDETSSTLLDLEATNGGFEWYLFRPVDLDTHSVARFLPYRGAAAMVAEARFANMVELSWVDRGFEESGYEVQRKDGTDSDYATVGITGANAERFIDTSTRGHTTYTYRARAQNSTGSSPWSEELVVETPRFRVEETGLRGSVYQESKLRIDSIDRFHVGYLNDEGLNHAISTGADWIESVVEYDRASDFSFDLDSQNRPHFAFQYRLDPVLGYRYKDGAVWRGQANNWDRDTIDLGQGSGEGVSISVDSTDAPAISQWSWSPRFWFSRWDGSTWQSEQISVTRPTISLAFDTHDAPVLVFDDYNSDDLVVARKNPDWEYSVVDPNMRAMTGQLHVLVDDADGAHVLYRDRMTDSFGYARPSGAGTWSLERLLSGIEDGSVPDAKMAANGDVHVLLWDSGACVLYYGVRDNIGWEIERVTSYNNDNVGAMSLALDSSQTPYLILGRPRSDGYEDLLLAIDDTP